MSNVLPTAGNSPFAGTVINVMDKGAVGDGTANDTPSIQAAIAAADDGGAIYFRRDVPRQCPLVPTIGQLYFSLGDKAVIKADAAVEPFSVFKVKSGPVEFHRLTLDLSKDPDKASRLREAEGGACRDRGRGRRRRDRRARRRLVPHPPQPRSGDPRSRQRRRVAPRPRHHPRQRRRGLLRVRRHARQGQRRPRRDLPVRRLPERNRGRLLPRRRGLGRQGDQQQAPRDRVPVLVRLARARLRREVQRRQGTRGNEAARLGIAAGGGPERRTPNNGFTIIDNICEGNYAGGITLDPTIADDPKTDDEDESARILVQRARISGNVCRGRRGGSDMGGDSRLGPGIHVRNSSNVVVTDNLCHTPLFRHPARQLLACPRARPTRATTTTTVSGSSVAPA